MGAKKCIVKGVIKITKRNDLSVKIDYLSMIAENISAEDFIIYILHLPPEIFLVRNGKVPHKAYTKLYQAGNIKVFGDIPSSEENPRGLGCYLVMSGNGCKEFFDCFCMNRCEEEINYGHFFRSCNRRNKYYGILQYHLTRLDIAIDDRGKSPFFTIEQLHKKCVKNEFVSKSRNYRFIESSIEELDTAKTLYIGDGKSNLSYRFYDKDKEQCMKYNKSLEEIGSWKRTELQLRDEMAHEFAMLMAKEPYMLSEQIFDLLGSSLRFVTPDKQQSNKSRWQTSRFWKRFLGAIKPLKIEIEQPENSLYDTQKWLQEGGALSAVKVFLFLQEYDALGDLKDLKTLLYSLSYSPSLSAKVCAHLTKINRQDLLPYIYQNTR